MVKKVSAAHAKAHLSELTADVAHGGHRVIIERHGKAVAALVSVEDLQQLGPTMVERPLGALALLGAWSEMDPRKLDKIVKDIYAQRRREKGRPVKLEE